MNWILKCAAFYGLRALPKGAYRALQRTVTHRHQDDLTPQFLAAYASQVEVFKSAGGGVALEFGGGRNLLTPLLLSAAGAVRTYAYDISRLATLKHVNHVIGQLERLGLPGDWKEIADLDADLKEKYRIEYCAPGDARATRLADGSVDFICSTSTLEHIPEQDIVAILAECRRICRPQGRLSMIIDYHDHYATSDPNITRFNFYKFSRRLWGLFNPADHYQNRLRHSDFERLFSAFRIVRADAIVPEADAPGLAKVPLSREFERYSKRDLLALNGYFELCPE